MKEVELLKKKIKAKFAFVCKKCLTEKNTVLETENNGTTKKMYIKCRDCGESVLINQVFLK